MKPQIVLLVFAFLSIINQQSNAQEKIIFGQDAAEGAYPFMVALLNSDIDNPESAHVCGGSLIRPNWVLTAGHCISLLDVLGIENLDVLIGSNSLVDLSANHERIGIDQMFLHPNYNANGQRDFDIALLRLSSSSTYEPIDLPAQGNFTLYQAGSNSKVLGWGLADTMTMLSSNYLQEADIQIISTDDCNSENSYDGEILDNMFCAGYTFGQSPTGAASGDSGGPLFIDFAGEWLQIGLVSWGETSWTTKNFPGVYQKVAKHRDWIESTIDENSVPTKDIAKVDEIAHVYYSNQGLNINFHKVQTEAVELYVFDILGKKIFTTQLQHNQNNALALSTISSGLYVISLKTKTHIYSSSFVKID